MTPQQVYAGSNVLALAKLGSALKAAMESVIWDAMGTKQDLHVL